MALFPFKFTIHCIAFIINSKALRSSQRSFVKQQSCPQHVPLVRMVPNIAAVLILVYNPIQISLHLLQYYPLSKHFVKGTLSTTHTHSHSHLLFTLVGASGGKKTSCRNPVDDLQTISNITWHNGYQDNINMFFCLHLQAQ